MGGAHRLRVLLTSSDSCAVTQPLARYGAGYAAGQHRRESDALSRIPAGAPDQPLQQDLIDQVCRIVSSQPAWTRRRSMRTLCPETPEWDSLAQLMILDALEKVVRGQAAAPRLLTPRRMSASWTT